MTMRKGRSKPEIYRIPSLAMVFIGTPVKKHSTGLFEYSYGCGCLSVNVGSFKYIIIFIRD